MRKTLIFCVFLGFSLALIGQNTIPAVLNCASVVNADQVELTWQRSDGSYVPNLFGQFAEYEIYRADDINGPFTLIATVGNITPASYIDVTANADAGERFYYIIKNYVFEDSEPSNTIASIHLERIPTNNLSISLTWNTDNITSGFGSIFGDYELEKQVDGGLWETVATGSAFLDSYSANINDCHGENDFLDINYRVRVAHPASDGVSTECIAYSNIINGEFKDLNPPDQIVIETVSVDYVTGETEVFWYPNTAVDLGEYYVLSVAQGGFAVLNIDNTQDSVLVPLAFGEDPSQESYAYSLLATDDCYWLPLIDPGTGDTTLLPNFGTPGDAHNTIFLEVSYNLCAQELFFDWNAYDDWPAGVSHYEIQGSINNGPLQILSIVPSSQSSVSLSDLDLNEEYCFIVNAVCADASVRSSQSNKACFETLYPPVAEDFGIANVSVVNSNEVEVVFQIDQAVAGAKYRLEKLSVFGDQYDELLTYPQALADVNGLITYHDLNATNDNLSHSYRLTAIDSCNNDVFTTPVSSTVHLEVFSEIEDFSSVLTWNPYEYWIDGVQEYRVYFSHDENMPNDPKFVMGPQEYYKRDVVDEFRYTENKFCYRIDAVESGPQNDKYISRSNVKCVGQTPLFYLPNAFVINGVNNIFRPYGSFLQFDDFSMEIYNRWGQLIYETTDFYEGWDGSFKGNFVGDGLYGYFITYKNGDGTEGRESGVVTVLRAY